MKPLYFVLIGDIVRSRQIQDRAQIQASFFHHLQVLGDAYGGLFVSPPTLTIGDEFQAVLKHTQKLFLFIHELECALHPVQLRFGFAIGEIETPLNTKAAIGMDGSAFHGARVAIEKAKELERRYFLANTSHPFNYGLALLVNWIDGTLKNWNIDKIKILTAHRQGLKQKEIAAQLSLTQPAVSQQINRHPFQLVLESEQFLERQFELILKG